MALFFSSLAFIISQNWSKHYPKTYFDLYLEETKTRITETEVTDEFVMSSILVRFCCHWWHIRGGRRRSAAFVGNHENNLLHCPVCIPDWRDETSELPSSLGINPIISESDTIKVYTINIKAMYRMYSRQPRFLRLFLIFLLSARKAGILKHFSKLPLLSNTLIVKSQSTAIFCPLLCVGNHITWLLYTILTKYPWCITMLHILFTQRNSYSNIMQQVSILLSCINCEPF